MFNIKEFEKISQDTLDDRCSSLIREVGLNSNMLDQGKKRLKNKNIKFIKANAESLPFKDNKFDKYIISFCLRNVTNIDKTLKEAFRVIKPGGVFFCLEFSSPSSIITTELYKKYRKRALPWIGKLIAKNLRCH